MEPLISFHLCEDDHVYQPGEHLNFEYQLDAVDAWNVLAVETSVLWYTEGKGDQDMAVHYFQRRVPGDVPDGDRLQLKQYQVPLPNSPFSYAGVTLKVRWCVRVRTFLRQGKETRFEQPFLLGHIPQAKAVSRVQLDTANSTTVVG